MTTLELDNVSVEHHKKQAKSLLQAFLSGDADAVRRVHKYHPEFINLPVKCLQTPKFLLADAQLVIAREQGIPSWPQLKRQLDNQRHARETQSLADDTTALETLIASYRSALAADAPFDSGCLDSGLEIVTRRLRRKSPIDRAMIHQIRFLCQWRDDSATYLKALDRHLQGSLSPDDELWARAEAAIALAIMARTSAKRAAEAVNRHRDMIAWATTALPADRLFSPMLWGMTIAKCWLKADGGGDEWLRRSAAAFAVGKATPENRRERFELVRTRALVQSLLDRNGDSLQTLEQASFIAHEDRDWPERHFAQVRAAAVALEFYRKENDKVGVLRAIRNGSKALSNLRAQCGDGGDYPAACDCFGHSLFRIQRYEEAIPLLHQSIGPPERSLNPWGLTVLAAAMWATTHDQRATLPLLCRAASVSRTNSYVDLAQLPEFADVLDDPEFVAAVAR